MTELSDQQISRLESVYYLYLDEYGHAPFRKRRVYNRVKERFLTLAGILLRGDVWWNVLCKRMDDLKTKHFNDPQIRLHYTELASGRGVFGTFSEEKRYNFWSDFLDLISEIPCQLVSITVDKERMQEKYSVYWDDPYHLLLAFQIERLIYFLSREEQKNESTRPTPLHGRIIIESRGDKPDKRLKDCYKRIYDSGSPRFHSLTTEDVQRYLASNELAISSKDEGRKGLEAADLVCNTLHWNTLFEFCPDVIEQLEGTSERSRGVLMFWKKVQHRIAADGLGNRIGYGLKLFPEHKNKERADWPV